MAVAEDLPPAGQPVDDGAGLAEELNENPLQNSVPVENIKRNKGDIFYFQKPDGEMALWQALENTIAGTDPNDSELFMEISQFPNGQIVETKKSFSDLETFEKGDQIYYEGKFYQAKASAAGATATSLAATSLEAGLGGKRLTKIGPTVSSNKVPLS